jgi:hypothetical protein
MFFSIRELPMETADGHIPACSSAKTPEALVPGAMGDYGEEYECYPRDLTHERRWRIISAYLRVLEDMKGPIAVDFELPCPKERIGQAILKELADDPESDLRRQLEIALVRLESFIPYEEYRVIEDFKDASLRSQEIADMRDPTSILRSALIMSNAKGESAVRFQEKIYEKMKARHLQIQQIGKGEAA